MAAPAGRARRPPGVAARRPSLPILCGGVANCPRSARRSERRSDPNGSRACCNSVRRDGRVGWASRNPHHQLVTRECSPPIALAARDEDAAVDRARKLFPVCEVPVCVDAEVRLRCEIEVGLVIDQNRPCVPGRRVRRDHVGFIGRVGGGRNAPQVGVGDDEDIGRLHVVVFQH